MKKFEACSKLYNAEYHVFALAEELQKLDQDQLKEFTEASPLYKEFLQVARKFVKAEAEEFGYYVSEVAPFDTLGFTAKDAARFFDKDELTAKGIIEIQQEAEIEKLRNTAKLLDGVLFKRVLDTSKIAGRKAYHISANGRSMEKYDSKDHSRFLKKLLKGYVLIFDFAMNCDDFKDYLVEKLEVDYLIVNIYSRCHVWLNDEDYK